MRVKDKENNSVFCFGFFYACLISQHQNVVRGGKHCDVHLLEHHGTDGRMCPTAGKVVFVCSTEKCVCVSVCICVCVCLYMSFLS